MSIVVQKMQGQSKPETSRRSARQMLGWQVQMSAKIWSPPTDVYERDDAYIVRVEIAGMRDADFTVAVEDGFLIISGSRPDVQERRAYRQMEIRSGKFSSIVRLPSLIDLEQAAAEYDDGFFVVVLPKIKPRKIEIQEE
jgi:HSP20 family protein